MKVILASVINLVPVLNSGIQACSPGGGGFPSVCNAPTANVVVSTRNSQNAKNRLKIVRHARVASVEPLYLKTGHCENCAKSNTFCAV